MDDIVDDGEEEEEEESDSEDAAIEEDDEGEEEEDGDDEAESLDESDGPVSGTFVCENLTATHVDNKPWLEFLPLQPAPRWCRRKNSPGWWHSCEALLFLPPYNLGFFFLL